MSAKYVYIGNCVDSFDEDSTCTNPDLPFEDVTQFAYADENSETITQNQFMNQIDLGDQNTREIFNNKKDNPDVKYLNYSDEDVIVIYDENEDIHYFFVK